MASTVVRQTTTVTSSSTTSSPVAVSFNTSFLTSVSGIFTCIELVLGIIVFSLCYSYGPFIPNGLFLLLISFAYWLMCFYILFSAILSITGSLLPSTFFFFLFHAFGFVLYISGGIAVLAKHAKSSSSSADVEIFGSVLHVSTYSASNPGLIAAGALALIAAVCHLVHVVFLYKGSRA